MKHLICRRKRHLGPLYTRLEEIALKLTIKLLSDMHWTLENLNLSGRGSMREVQRLSQRLWTFSGVLLGVLVISVSFWGHFEITTVLQLWPEASNEAEICMTVMTESQSTAFPHRETLSWTKENPLLIPASLIVIWPHCSILPSI